MTREPRVAVVTGGAAGIGAATVATLHRAGWLVHSVDLKESATPGVRSHVADVSDESALQLIAEEVGTVDAIVTAAGIHLHDDGPAHHLSLNAWDRTLAVNLTGTLLTVRTLYPQLREGGSIVTVGSVAGIAGMPGGDAYTASKGAIVAMTRTWAVDFSRYGVRVNCVCPGLTGTAMLDSILDDVDDPIGTPQQRVGSPEEVAAVIAFFASKESTFVSGAIVPVDGSASTALGGTKFPARRSRLPAE